VIGSHLMDLIDGDSRVTVFAHDVPDDLRQHIVRELVERRWESKSNPDNGDVIGVTSPDGTTYIALWPHH
jgi:hypothetical protein